MSTEALTESLTDGQISCQAGYLPVPLGSVPAAALAALPLYLYTTGSYTLYHSIGRRFEQTDKDRLLANGVEFVYVSVQQHKLYYQTIESHLSDIIADRHLQTQKKAEILYSTSLELASQLLTTPPGKEEISRVKNVAKSTVELIIKDNDAFKHLFDVSNHDFYTATHMVNVCTYTVVLADKLKISSREDIEQIATGALVHDIGKIFITDDLLNSTDKLTKEQYEILKNHVRLGIKHLEGISDLPDEALQAVLEHHERLDGSGYPGRLKGDEISQTGQMVAIVDSFDAMTSVRPYRDSSLSVEQAAEQLKAETPDKYNADMLSSFLSILAESSGCRPAKTDTESAVSNNTDGRKYMRHYFRINAIIQKVRTSNGQIELEPGEKMVIHNMSQSGVGFLSPKSFGPDENIVLTIPELRGTTAYPLIAVVAHCRKHPNGWHTVGAKFHQVQPQHILDQIS